MPDFSIRCDENGNENFIDARYPEYNIGWNGKASVWEYSIRMDRYKGWSDNNPLLQSEDAYKFLLQHFGLENFSDELTIDKVFRMSPSELEGISKTHGCQSGA